MEYRDCYKCSRHLPRTAVYYFRDKRRGFETMCKECRGYNFSSMDSIPEIKTCSTCGEKKENSKENFTKITRSKISKCRNCYLADNRKQNKKYKHNPDNREKILFQKKMYREKNKDKINDYKRAFYRTDHGQKLLRLGRHRRSAMKKKTLNTLTVNQWSDCLEYFGYSCAYCGEEKENLQQDHFHPVSKGGEYTVKNIIPACQSCNSSKRNEYFFDWYPEKEFYNEKSEKKILRYLGYKSNKQQIALF